ncbi:hypothetical protein [Mycolicibacterium stellerae]|uniref:hypothetical protein n=1 Tax=Mycolicibacterium stellerae TaxID=2358193 RepID=UPI001F276835|nr:hypothetical protein [Mycolicibacterium stellerae]
MTFPPPGPPPKRARPASSAGMAVLGVFVYFIFNFVAGFVGLLAGGSRSAGSLNVGIIGTAIVLVLVAFGGGGAMLASYNSNARGFGLGLMIGWALTSLFTVGICTGLNPEVYSM